MRTTSKVIAGVLTIGLNSAANAQDSDFWSKFQLNADEAPTQTPWTQAASIAYSSGEGEESKDIDIAMRYDFQNSPNTDSTGFVRFLTRVNDAKKKEEEVYKGSVGYHVEFATPDEKTLFFTDFSVSYQANTVFAKDDIEQCETTPEAVFCDDQTEEKAILAVDTVIYPSFLEGWTPSVSEGKFVESTPSILYYVSPVVSFFYDEVIDATTDPETGLKIDGAAAGTAVTLGGFLSPKFLDYKLEFKTSYKYVMAIDRSTSRKPGFKANTDLFTASIDYNFGKSSYLDNTGWRPAIGITYSSGADPLTGRKEKEETVIAFKLTHRAKKKK